MNVVGKLVACGILTGFIGSVQAHEHRHQQQDEIAPDTFAVDAAHTQIGFAVRHLGIVNVRGVFTDYEATLRMSENDVSSIELAVSIQASSINTGVGARDEHLRSADYFEVDTFPEINFVSSGVIRHGTGYALTGKMTIKEVSQEVTLPLIVGGPVSDPWGNTRIGVELSGELNRHDFGVAHDAMADKSISDIVRLDVQIQAIKQ